MCSYLVVIESNIASTCIDHDVNVRWIEKLDFAQSNHYERRDFWHDSDREKEAERNPGLNEG